VKQVKPITAMVVALCVTLVNADILHAVHVHQRVKHASMGNIPYPRGEQRPIHPHDPGKCTICLQLAAGKAASPVFPEPLSFSVSPVEEPILYEAFFRPAVAVFRESPRAPPTSL
jgi:hypothetical protein